MYPFPSVCRAWLIPAFLVIAAVITACAPKVKAPDPTAPPPPPTVENTATSTPEPPTSTPVPTNTPLPTRTPTPDRAATKMAQAEATVQSVVAHIQSEMKALELSSEEGHIEWFAEEKERLSVNTYQESLYATLPVGEVEDYIIHTDVTWDSSSGLAGCGIHFRANEDFQHGGHYDFVLMRLAFQPAWDIEYINFNKWQQTLTGKVMYSDVINDDPWGTNQLTLVVKGKEFTPYINGEKFRTVTHSKLTTGLIAFFAWQESGITHCEFENSWLWMPGPGDSEGPQSGMHGF